MFARKRFKKGYLAFRTDTSAIASVGKVTTTTAIAEGKERWQMPTSLLENWKGPADPLLEPEIHGTQHYCSVPPRQGRLEKHINSYGFWSSCSTTIRVTKRWTVRSAKIGRSTPFFATKTMVTARGPQNAPKSKFPKCQNVKQMEIYNIFKQMQTKQKTQSRDLFTGRPIST